jgi:hypothetical protein
MTWLTYKDAAEAAFVHEISALSDRLVGILAPIILEKRLTEAIQHRWVDNPIQGGTTIFKGIFGASGELGSFGTKIRVGLATGLYGTESYADLTRIEKIRNHFAHQLDVQEFEDQPVCDFVRCLTINGRWPDDKPIGITLGEHLVVIQDPELVPDPATLRGKFWQAITIFGNLLYHEGHVRRSDPRTPHF